MVRCPYCFDDLSAPSKSCGVCGTTVHSDCWDEHGRCVTLGCRPRLTVRLPRRALLAPLFALVNMVPVVVIAGFVLFLGFVVYANLCGIHVRSTETKVMADRDTLRKAIDIFKLNNNRFPSSMEELSSAGLIDSDPRDPWGNAYLLASDGRTIVVSVDSMMRFYSTMADR